MWGIRRHRVSKLCVDDAASAAVCVSMMDRDVQYDMCDVRDGISWGLMGIE